MSITVRRYLPIGITAGIALTLLADFFFESSALDAIGTGLKGWGTLVAAFALFLGMAQIGRLHLSRIMSGHKERVISVWLLVLMSVFFILGMTMGTKDPTYLKWYYVLARGVGTSTNAILAFYIFSAGYRVLRVRSIDTIAFMAAAIFCLLFSAPIGAAISPILPEIGGWFIDVPNSAAKMGLLIGIAVGTIALGVRTILGLELGYLGITGEEE